MNFGVIELDEDTQQFWGEVRAFFEEHVTDAVLDEERATGSGFSESLHLALGKRGWVAPRWPTAEGGAGLDALRARIIAEELARSRAPFILASTTLLPPIAIRMFGSAEMQSEILPRVADGTARICLGYTEPDCGSDLAAVRTRAVRDGASWIINGQKMFTTGAQHSQYCFLLVRTDPSNAMHKGLTVFLLPLDTAGVEIRPIGTLGGERTNFVYLHDVRVDDRWRIGEVNSGWAVVAAPLNAEHSMGGGDTAQTPSPYLAECEKLWRTTTDWAAATTADTGRSVLADPVVREVLAEIAVAIELARSTPGPMGRIACSDTLIRTASQLLDLVGPTAQLCRATNGAAANGDLEEGFRYAPGTAIYGGSTDIARNMVAERILGLPRSTPRRSSS
jgi:alkylation response protein AidB-like acyl-CoA dehydrogenase